MPKSRLSDACSRSEDNKHASRDGNPLRRRLPFNHGGSFSRRDDCDAIKLKSHHHNLISLSSPHCLLGTSSGEHPKHFRCANSGQDRFDFLKMVRKYVDAHPSTSSPIQSFQVDGASSVVAHCHQTLTRMCKQFAHIPRRSRVHHIDVDSDHGGLGDQAASAVA